MEHDKGEALYFSLTKISGPKWAKYCLDTQFTNALQKNLALLFTDKTSEGVKCAINELEREFTKKKAVIRPRDQLVLRSIWGIVCKYICILLKQEEVVERLYLFRGLLNIAIVISKNIPSFHEGAFWKLDKQVPLAFLFKTFSDNVEYFRAAAIYFALRPQDRTFLGKDPETIRDVIIAQLPLVDDLTQACLVLIGKPFFPDPKQYSLIDSFLRLGQIMVQLLAKPAPFLCKLFITMYFHKELIRFLQVPSDQLIQVLAEYTKWCDEYEATLADNFIDIQLAKTVASCAREFDSEQQLFFELSLANLKQLTSAKMTHNVVEMILLFVLESPLIPGIKIIDLPNMATTMLTELTTIDHIWSNEAVCNVLTRYCLPSTRESMVHFIQDTKIEDLKRFPRFDGLDLVPWSELEHGETFSYSRESTPIYLREMASWKPKTRRKAFLELRYAITYDGYSYEVTPYVVPFLLELLDATLVQDKHEILQLCTEMLMSRAEYLLNKQGLDLETVWMHEPEFLQLLLDIEKKFMADLPKIIGLLTNETNEVRGWAAHLLGLLPKSAHELVPKLRERYDIETDSKVKASLLVSLSLLWPRFDEDWTSFVTFAKHEFALYKGTNDLPLDFAAFACLARLEVLDKKTLQHNIRRFLMESEEISFKRANFVIRNPKEFILKLMLKRNDMPDFLPLVIQQLDSDDLFICVYAVMTMFEQAFRSFRLYHMRFWEFSSQQVQVLTAAAGFYGSKRLNGRLLYDPENPPLLRNKEDCLSYIEDAQVAEDLYGLD